MKTIRIVRAAHIEGATEAVYEACRSDVLELLPRAEIEHVGSTAIPAALTKGDVDVLVRVSRGEFAAAIEVLKRRYAVHQRHNWTTTLASFRDPQATEPEVGIQLVVAGSHDDRMFVVFRDALVRDPSLLAEYNALKRRLDGADYENYTAIKGEFVERVLDALGPRDGS